MTKLRTIVPKVIAEGAVDQLFINAARMLLGKPWSISPSSFKVGKLAPGHASPAKYHAVWQAWVLWLEEKYPGHELAASAGVEVVAISDGEAEGEEIDLPRPSSLVVGDCMVVVHRFSCTVPLKVDPNYRTDLYPN